MDVINASGDQQVDETTLEKWREQQETLRLQVVPKDIYDWQKNRNVSLVGGLDLSFVKGKDDMACAALVVCQLPDLNIVYEDVSLVPLTVPYIPGFLAFREAPSLIKAINKLAETNPNLVPQCLLVDGNGMLHPRLCGLAVHLGVLCGIPTVGVAKNLFHMDGLQRDEEHTRRISELKNPGDFFPLESISGEILGRAVKTCDKAHKPVFVSIGNKISLETAAWIVVKCSRYRVPEPIRLADMGSRKYLRKNYPSTQQSTYHLCEDQTNDGTYY